MQPAVDAERVAGLDADARGRAAGGGHSGVAIEDEFTVQPQREASSVVCQRGSGVALKPNSPLTARVSGVTGAASALAPLRVMPRASLLW